jgi:hypothetical protein
MNTSTLPSSDAPSLYLPLPDRRRAKRLRLVSARLVKYGCSHGIRCPPVVPLGQGDENNNGHQDQDSEDEDAAFGTGGSSAQNGLAHGVRCKETEWGGKSGRTDPMDTNASF